MKPEDKRFNKIIEPFNPDNSNQIKRDSIKDNAGIKQEPPMIKPSLNIKDLSSLVSDDYLPLNSLNKKYSRKNHESKDAEIFYVPRLLLPKNVLGMYVPSNDPSSDTIYLASDRYAVEMTDVSSHEISHASLRGGNEDLTNIISSRGYMRIPVSNIKQVENSYRNQLGSLALSC